MATAYLATSGSYSDFHVQRVFLDKTLAEKCHDDGLCDEIHEFEITDTEVKSVSMLHLQWESAHIRPSGPVDEGEWSRVERVEFSGQPACKHSVHHREDSLLSTAHVMVFVEGHDHERVRKVLSEQVAMVKAQLSEPGETEA